MTAVSIIMPVYNGADYLDGALASLSKQIFQDMKIIISDNASTDATPEIIAKWKALDPRIVSHRQKENIGAVNNFTFVLGEAQTPWVMFACHDDLWSPDYVTELYKAATEEKDIWLAVGDMTLIRPDGSRKNWPFDARINQAKGLARAYLSMMRVTSGWYYGLYNRQYLVSMYKAGQRYKYAWGGDFIVLLPFLLAGRVRGSNAAIYYKRETPLSAARYKPKTLADQYDLYSSFLKVSWLMLREASLPWPQRLLLAPLLLIYTDRYAWKLRRVLRSAILQCLPLKAKPKA